MFSSSLPHDTYKGSTDFLKAHWKPLDDPVRQPQHPSSFNLGTRKLCTKSRAFAKGCTEAGIQTDESKDAQPDYHCSELGEHAVPLRGSVKAEDNIEISLCKLLMQSTHTAGRWQQGQDQDAHRAMPHADNVEQRVAS